LRTLESSTIPQLQAQNVRRFRLGRFHDVMTKQKNVVITIYHYLPTEGS
jgi:hypothetical protein